MSTVIRSICGSMEMAGPVAVIYKCVDGAHFFVSGDPGIKGLCVASTNLELAYGEVGRQLGILVSKATGKPAHFEPAVSLAEFEKWAIIPLTEPGRLLEIAWRDRSGLLPMDRRDVHPQATDSGVRKSRKNSLS